MPKKKPLEKAKQALRKGKSPSTAAGEFIRAEMDRMGDGKRDAASRKKAIAIGLAKARRAGIPLRPQPETPAEERSRRSVERAYQLGQTKKRKSVASGRASSRRRKPGPRRKRVASRSRR